MLDVLIDTLLDIVKLIPFLFLSFLILEFIEHKFSNKSAKFVSKSGKFGSIIGSLLGAVPQCGFSVVATNLYVSRIITLGTLISIYLSTSDEMLPILLSSNVEVSLILKIVGIKVLIGMICGFIIDLIYQNKEKKNYHICEDDDCDCEHSLLKSTLIHTSKTIIYIGIVIFILNTLFFFVDESIITSLFKKNIILSSVISPIFGLIPSCASSIVLTELYINNVLPLGTVIGGLLTGSGVSILVLFKNNKNLKENLLIVGTLYIIGVVFGILLNILM